MTPASGWRRCPVPGCGADLRAGHLMCRPCWANVPRAAQQQVHAAWRAIKSAPLSDCLGQMRAYREAADAAIAAAEVRR
ncbi:MAG: hypothetical protein OHK0024_21070 [Thalassobaculales bacterium]